MGRRSRKRRPEGPRPAGAMARGYARSEERNERIRRRLEPLAPGEVPGAVKVAVAVAALFAVANTVALALGRTFTGDAVVPGVAFSIVLVVTAVFMWRGKYWAVLGFQSLLALQIISAAVALLVVDDWRAALVLVAVVLLGGWLFWKLVRALARLQMPAR
jgi:hypothetical protein